MLFRTVDRVHSYFTRRNLPRFRSRIETLATCHRRVYAVSFELASLHQWHYPEHRTGTDDRTLPNVVLRNALAI